MSEQCLPSILCEPSPPQLHNRADSVARWLRLFKSPTATFRPALIDIRPTPQFESEHIIHSTHFDGLYGLNGLSNRLSELPPPQHRQNIAIIASTRQQSADATSLLHRKGFHDILPLSVKDIVPFIQTEAGKSSARLWHPAPIVENSLSFIGPQLPSRIALDVGAGAGRDTAFLVEQGFKVTAVDRDPLLMQKCLQLVRRYSPDSSRSVRAVVHTFGADLTKDIAFLQSNISSLVVVVRFLRRGVLDLLWHAVAPGGFVLYEHFLEGCQHLGGPVKPSQMLQPGELRSVFSKNRGFTVVKDEEATLPDGRPVARFIAKRDCHVERQSGHR